MGSSGSGGGVPPGFRFHPTDEELLHYYLKKKVTFQKFEMEVIREVDLNKIEPWDLQERCRIGSTPQNEWYFFSHKDRKYPTGSRTNRATNAGFWKATGRDKCIRTTSKKIGMRKTLVFYRGRAPHGQKTDWIMHEYRLEDGEHDADQANGSEDGWVICRVFKKKNLFKVGNHEGTIMTQDQPLNMNTSNTNQFPRTSLIMQMRDNPLYHTASTQLQTFDLYKSHDLALNYSHLPSAISGYDSTSAHHHVLQAQDFIPRLDCNTDQSESLRYQSTCEAGLQVERSDHDHQNLNDGWGMLVAPFPHDQHHHSHSSPKEGRFEDTNASSSSMPHMNHQLPLRGEMDFWGYDK